MDAVRSLVGAVCTVTVCVAAMRMDVGMVGGRMSDGLALVRLFAHRREGVEHNAEDDVEEEHEHHNEEEQVEDGALCVRAVGIPE